MSAQPTGVPAQPADPEHSISVGQLRQNPTRMLREVRRGSVWTITDHGEPIAEVRPLRRGPWVSSEDVAALLRELGSDEAWAAELTEDRRHVELRDPWDGVS